VDTKANFIKLQKIKAARTSQIERRCNLTACCSNHFSMALKRFLINLRLAPGDSKTRPLGSTIKNISMSAQRDFRLGNSPFNNELTTRATGRMYEQEE